MRPSNILSKLILIIFFIVILNITSCDVSNNSLSKNTDNSNQLGSNEDLSLFEDDRVSVSSTTDTLSNESNAEYTILFKSNLNNSEEISFDIIQIKDMDNFLIAEIANESIETAMTNWISGKAAMTNWISGKAARASSVDLDILCHSDKYLSFVNNFEYRASRVDYIKD